MKYFWFFFKIKNYVGPLIILYDKKKLHQPFLRLEKIYIDIEQENNSKRNEFLLVIQTRVGLHLKTILLTIVVKFGSVLQVDSKNLD